MKKMKKTALIFATTFVAISINAQDVKKPVGKKPVAKPVAAKPVETTVTTFKTNMALAHCT